MGHRKLAALAAMAGIAFATAGAQQARATEAPGSPGSVRYTKATSPEFDRFTNDGATWGSWMNDHFWRMRTYTPYFDGKTSWYGRAWVYRDLYSIGTSSDLVQSHPDWILHDGAGHKLFIPWGCSNGTCPLYAADFGNPEFRAYWIEEARKTFLQPYKGLFIDDVNLDFRVGDGNGSFVAPVDQGTGGQMTETDWRREMADFLEQIRAAFPAKEIVQNAIWYAPEQEPNVARALRAADYINLERGINDSGITRGGSTFGYETFLSFIDHRHAEGHGVVFDSYATAWGDCRYGLATYFLVNDGRDTYSGPAGSTPESFWSGWQVQLGDARGARRGWNGLLRRDFDKGLVLVNEPDAPTITVDLNGSYLDLDGYSVSSVTLGPASGAVLTRASAGAEPSVPALPSASAAADAPATDSGPIATAGSAPAAPAATRPASQPCANKRRPPRRARVSLRITRGDGTRRTAIVCGVARQVRAGKAKIRVHRETRGGWTLVRRKSVRVDGRGRFRATFPGLAAGRYRADAKVGSARSSRSVATASRHFVLSR
jgi:hypothetical protein